MKIKRQNQQEAMIKALHSSLGNVTKACEETGVKRRTHYDWLEKDQKYRERVNQIFEVEKDFAENQLRTLMREKNPTAIIFFLKTKGKDRGYVEQQDLNISNRPAYEKLAETFEEIEQSSKKSNKE